MKLIPFTLKGTAESIAQFQALADQRMVVTDELTEDLLTEWKVRPGHLIVITTLRHHNPMRYRYSNPPMYADSKGISLMYVDSMEEAMGTARQIRELTWLQDGVSMDLVVVDRPSLISQLIPLK